MSATAAFAGREPLKRANAIASPTRRGLPGEPPSRLL
jgi:hypothetical protein